jgi:hypothetical protein
MPIKALKRIYGSAKLKKLPEKELHIRDAWGNNLGYKGTYLIPMLILGRKVMHDLVVLEHVQDYILVIDFICEHSLGYNSHSEKCFCKTPPRSASNVRLLKPTSFQQSLLYNQCSNAVNQINESTWIYLPATSHRT